MLSLLTETLEINLI